MLDKVSLGFFAGIFALLKLRRPSTQQLAVEEVHLLRLEVEKTHNLVVELESYQQDCLSRSFYLDLFVKLSVLVDISLVVYIVYLKLPRRSQACPPLLRLGDTGGSDSDSSEVPLIPSAKIGPIRPSDLKTWPLLQ